MLSPDVAATYVVDFGARYVKVAAAHDTRPRLLMRLPTAAAAILQTSRDRAAIIAVLAPTLRRLVVTMPPGIPGHEALFGASAAKAKPPLAGEREAGAAQVLLLTHPVSNPDVTAAVVEWLHDAGVSSVAVRDGLVAPLLAASLTTGLVVDIGHGGTRCAVVAHGLRDPRAVAFSPRGAATVLHCLRQLLARDAGTVIGKRALRDEVLEDVLFRGSCVAPPHPARAALWDFTGTVPDPAASAAAASASLSPGADSPLAADRTSALGVGVPLLLGGDVIVARPAIALEALFAEPDDDDAPSAAAADAALFADVAGLGAEFPRGPSVHVTAARALLACPPALRHAAVRSIVIVGGVSDAPNLRRRVAEGIVAAVQRRAEFAPLRPLLAELEAAIVASAAPYSGGVAAVMGAVVGLRPPVSK